jgi:hypothetical protein
LAPAAVTGTAVASRSAPHERTDTQVDLDSIIISSFEAVRYRSIPLGATMFRTRAYNERGATGAARYVEFDEGSTAANAAYVAAHPLTSVKTANNRYFRLMTSDVVTLLMVGAPFDENDASSHLRELLDIADFIEVPAGYAFNIGTPIVRKRDGLFLTGFGTIWRKDQHEDFIQLAGCDHHRIIGPTFRTNRTWGVEWTNVKCCIRGMNGASDVEVSARFENTQFCAVDGNVGSNWRIHHCHFKDISASAVDIRGGQGHQIVDNYVDGTGDDALTIAGHGSESIIANNVVRRAGMIVIYNHSPLAQGGGGGIRINGSVSVTGNRLYNCNLFFVTAASYSRDPTARPHKCVIAHNVGRGLKPTVTVGSPLSIKDSDDVTVLNNNWDVRSGETDVTITNVADNGSGFARVTAPAHGYYTGNRVRIDGAGGVANGVSLVTVIDADTFDMTQLAFSGSYTGDGVAFAGLHYTRISNNTATRTKRVRIRGDVVANIESIFFSNLGGFEELDCEGIDVTNYFRATDWDGGFTIRRWRFCNNTLRFPRARAGALFSATGAGQVVLGSGLHEINDNEIIEGAGKVDMPLAFGGISCDRRGRVTALRNRLAGATAQISGIDNIKQFLFDGDHSSAPAY